MCIQGIKAQEAYAVYEDGVLTFYYDADKSLRSGVVYDLKNVEGLFPDWYFDGTRNNVTAVAFKSSFANARPTTTAGWFDSMENLTKIDGLTYLNTSAVTSMRSMFGYCKKLTSLNLESFDTRNVTSMKNMFVNCSSMLRIFHNFNTANVTDMSGMFRRCEKLKTLDLHTFSTANVTDMSYMFSGCFDLSSLSVENFNTSKVTDMSNMFWGCGKLETLDLSNFTTANVTDMSYMFTDCSMLFKLDLRSFSTSKVTNMREMFSRCSWLMTIYAGRGWSTAAVSTSADMFTGCTSLVGSAGTVYDASHVDATYARIDGGASSPGYLSTGQEEAYAVYEDGMLTFYYDAAKEWRTGKAYLLN
ncbi:MAG: BspA family leucine-rich repeat surface protein, partial [Alloprevotella sp.]|nr:BspA family leucine-rich repeat surface protein [Alloprevotella sp.]